MAAITVTEIPKTGVAPPSLSAANAGGDTFVNDGKTFLHVANGSGGALTVTVDAQRLCDQGFDHDAIVSVPAGTERYIGPFPKNIFNTTGGVCDVSYSGVTSLTIGALKLAG